LEERVVETGLEDDDDEITEE